VLVGQKKALAMAVKNHLGRRRWTKLREWLGVGLQSWSQWTESSALQL